MVADKKSTMHVAVCGPLPDKAGNSHGGFQAANGRILSTLKENGYSVTALPYFFKGGATKGEKLRGYILGFWNIFRDILFRKRDIQVLHMTPLFRHFIWVEYLIMKWAQRFFPVVVDIRAGSRISHYQSRSALYRIMFRRMILSADHVMYEGHIYKQFLQELGISYAPSYFPNFVESCLCEYGARGKRIAGTARIIYVGAVTSAKGCDKILMLHKHLPVHGIEPETVFIGRPDSKFSEIANSAPKGVHFLGEQPSQVIYQHLAASDYFLFLTTWEGEGHSNALTEAMALGCVPICTDHGFNEDVVGKCGLVVSSHHDLHSISDFIISTEIACEFESFSSAARNRVAMRFTDRQAIETLEKVYSKMASDYRRS